MTQPRVKKRHIAAVVTGNALEFYDFVTYSFFAVYIGRTFFPSENAGTSVLASLATFGVGFLMRPVGAYVIGRMGDRIGRKPAMLISFSLMGIGIAGLALTPSYAQIGVAAQVLVVLFRLLQGFALGGEVGPTTAFLIEAAPPHRRGLYGSLQYTTQDVAVLVAGVVGVVLANHLSEQQLQDWGWRLALLIGVIIVPFGLLLRRTLPETFHAPETEPTPSRGAVRPYLLVAILAGVMLMATTIATYTGDYLTTYAIHNLHMSAGIAFGAPVVIGLTGIVFEPLSGLLSDRYGRKPVMLIPLALLALLFLPSFMVMSAYRSGVALYGATFVMSALLGLGAPAILTALTETLPPHIRSGAVALVYAIAISVFGGSTQFVIGWMIEATGNPLAPAWYATGAMALGLLAMLAAKESAPVKLNSSPA